MSTSKLPIYALSFAVLGLAGQASAATCSSFDASVSYGEFDSCTVEGNTGNGNGNGNNGGGVQDDFATVSAIVSALFGDEGITLSATGSYAPRSGTGEEFFGDRDTPTGLFDITPDTVMSSTTFTFESLPSDTLFVSLKQGNGFELFGLGIDGRQDTPFTLTHSLNGDGTSHISTFAGMMEGTEGGDNPNNPPNGPAPIPLPASALLLLGALGGLGAWRRKS